MIFRRHRPSPLWTLSCVLKLTMKRQAVKSLSPIQSKSYRIFGNAVKICACICTSNRLLHKTLPANIRDVSRCRINSDDDGLPTMYQLLERKRSGIGLLSVRLWHVLCMHRGVWQAYACVTSISRRIDVCQHHHCIDLMLVRLISNTGMTSFLLWHSNELE